MIGHGQEAARRALKVLHRARRLASDGRLLRDAVDEALRQLAVPSSDPAADLIRDALSAVPLTDAARAGYPEQAGDRMDTVDSMMDAIGRDAGLDVPVERLRQECLDIAAQIPGVRAPEVDDERIGSPQFRAYVSAPESDGSIREIASASGKTLKKAYEALAERLKNLL